MVDLDNLQRLCDLDAYAAACERLCVWQARVLLVAAMAAVTTVLLYGASLTVRDWLARRR